MLDQEIYILETEEARCELWRYGDTYTLFVDDKKDEGFFKHRSFRYQNTEDGIFDAFEDAKDFCDISYWDIDWNDIEDGYIDAREGELDIIDRLDGLLL